MRAFWSTSSLTRPCTSPSTSRRRAGRRTEKSPSRAAVRAPRMASSARSSVALKPPLPAAAAVAEVLRALVVRAGLPALASVATWIDPSPGCQDLREATCGRFATRSGGCGGWPADRLSVGGHQLGDRALPRLVERGGVRAVVELG